MVGGEERERERGRRKACVRGHGREGRPGKRRTGKGSLAGQEDWIKGWCRYGGVLACMAGHWRRLVGNGASSHEEEEGGCDALHAVHGLCALRGDERWEEGRRGPSRAAALLAAFTAL